MKLEMETVLDKVKRKLEVENLLVEATTLIRDNQPRTLSTLQTTGDTIQ